MKHINRDDLTPTYKQITSADRFSNHDNTQQRLLAIFTVEN